MTDLNKINHSTRKISVEILTRVFENGIYTDELLAETFQNESLNQRDKSLVTELVNGTLRWRGNLDYQLAHFFKGDFYHSPIKLRSILELSLYQIIYLNKIPKYAAVSEGVKIAKMIGGRAWSRLVNGVLRTYLRQESPVPFPSIKENPVSALATNHSHPHWLIERWLVRYGLEQTRQLRGGNNGRPLTTIRVNVRKTTRKSLIDKFVELGLAASPSKYFKDFIKITNPRTLTDLPGFKEGMFTIKYESTALAPLLLAPEPVDVILDMCAAPGGKACYLAELLEDNGKIIAVDQNYQRISLLKMNMNRLNIITILPIIGDSTKISIKPVNKILVDAPCSGLGVLSKRSDLRWKRKFADIRNIKQLQRMLLENANRLLKAGGILVYSTCTLEPEENEEVISEFLIRHQEYRMVNNDSNKTIEIFKNA